MGQMDLHATMGNTCKVFSHNYVPASLLLNFYLYLLHVTIQFKPSYLNQLMWFKSSTFSLLCCFIHVLHKVVQTFESLYGSY